MAASIQFLLAKLTKRSLLLLFLFTLCSAFSVPAQAQLGGKVLGLMKNLSTKVKDAAPVINFAKEAAKNSCFKDWLKEKFTQQTPHEVPTPANSASKFYPRPRANFPYHTPFRSSSRQHHSQHNHYQQNRHHHHHQNFEHGHGHRHGHNQDHKFHSKIFSYPSGIGLGVVLGLGLGYHYWTHINQGQSNDQETGPTSACDSGPTPPLAQVVPEVIPLAEALSHVELSFPESAKTTMQIEKDLNFPVQVEVLATGVSQYSLSLFEPSEFCASALKGIDVRHMAETPNNLLLASKTATIVKGKDPELFSRNFFTNIQVLSTLFPGAEFSPGSNKKEVKIKQNIAVGPISVGTIHMDLQFDQFNPHNHKKTGHGGKSPTSSFPAEVIKLISEQDSDLGEPHHVAVIEVKNASSMLNGSFNVLKFYRVKSHNPQNQEESEHNTLVISYNLTGLKKSDIKLPLWTIRGTIQNSAKTGAEDLINVFRQYQ